MRKYLSNWRRPREIEICVVGSQETEGGKEAGNRLTREGQEGKQKSMGHPHVPWAV